ncbi:MAG TPA: hypothetical protein VHW24_00435 [Bryobacteraceae bacterium]|nr:hypothetical protein [Bryobacteraceae bacterium]
MTPENSIEYRRLPGRLRGLIRGSSVWAASDHLLLVRSYRFREEYKRFYFRDVQAIAVADAPRFHISTRSLLIGWIFWIIAGIGMTRAPAAGTVIACVVFGVLILAWIGISWFASCRCRIYTAVSSDELPSVYRRWTARDFLDEVNLLITGTQGTLQELPAEALDERGVGPATPRIAEEQAAAAEAYMPPRTIVSDLLIVTLLADAALRLVPLHSPVAVRWVSVGTVLALMAAAVGVMVQRHRGLIRATMQKLAIAAVVLLGMGYYAQALAGGMIAGIAAGRTHSKTIQVSLNDPQVPVVNRVRASLEAALGIVGIALSFMSHRAAPNAPLE